MRRAIRQEWTGYRERVMPAEASVIQVRECRRAFYAGAEALLRSIMVGLDPGTEATDADLARMDDLNAELREFAQDVAEGRA